MKTALRKLAFVDIETSGGHFTKDKIIEIGILRIEDNQVVSTFNSLINPQTNVSPFILDLTSIRQEDLEKAPTFNQVKQDVLQMIEGCVFVAHNARFDYGFIKSSLKIEGISFAAKQLCTVKLSRLLNPSVKRHNLDNLISLFNIPCNSRHRAFDDAQAMFDLYQKFMSIFGKEAVEEKVAQLIKEPSVPPKLSKDIVKALPEKPGVYIFYSQDGAPLYVGKSINIKERVLSHFSESATSSREHRLCQEIASIETITTTGEFSALLKENELIKSMYPIYNRKQRKTQKLLMVSAQLNQNGYLVPETREFSEADSFQSTTQCAFFRSVRAFKKAMIEVSQKHQLCHKLLGLEHTSSPCFNYHLKQCSGACLGKEVPEIYNLRMYQALEEISIKTWPYSTPVMIEESDREVQQKQCFIIDNWKVIGQIQFDGEVSNPQKLSQTAFNLDTYKIIKKAILKPFRRTRVKQVSYSQIEALFQ